MEHLQQLYANYGAAVEAARKESSFMADFLGTAGSVKRHPCHQEFFQDVESWVKAFAASGATSAAAKEAAMWLLTEPQTYRETDCYWFMLAAVGFLKLLVPLLSQGDAGAVLEKMDGLYKRRDRSPVMDEAHKLLKKQARS